MSGSPKIKAIIRCGDDHEADCFVIWNTNVFFQQLNESYPRTIDYCLDAQRAFIELWFADSENPARMDEFRKAMRIIIRDRTPLSFLAESFLRYLKGFSPSGHAELISLALRGIPGDRTRIPDIDALLSRLLWNATPGVSFANALITEARLHGRENATVV